MHPPQRVTLVLLSLLLVALPLGCKKKASGPGNTGMIGGMTVTLSTDPSPAVVGHDTLLRFEITENGTPVQGCQLSVDTHYVNMDRDGPVGLSATEVSPGVYEARDVSTGMNGKWEATVTVTPPSGQGGTVTLGFRVAK